MKIGRGAMAQAYFASGQRAVWYPHDSVKPLLIACDFDGTITRRDTLHVIVEAFGERGVWERLEPRLRLGEITVEQAMQIQFAEVRATPDQVRAVVREHAPIRDGFGEWVEWCATRGYRLVVTSNGFRSIIDPVLEDAGFGHLEVVAHDAAFSSDGCHIGWADRGAQCTLCGRPCKRAPLRARWHGERLVYLGDGISDRCVSLMADVVFARDGLAEHLAQQQVAYLPFEDFVEVREALSNIVGAHA
jgi:2-hydroxy-3-keto-5-methylthiopentenyl-1-phosphate phosphatase